MTAVTELNPHIYRTAAETNVMETWKKNGFVPPSEIEEYRLRWLEFRSLHLRNQPLDETTPRLDETTPPLDETTPRAGSEAISPLDGNPQC